MPWSGPSPTFGHSLLGHAFSSCCQPRLLATVLSPVPPSHPAQTPPSTARASGPPASTRLSPSLARGAALTGGKRPPRCSQPVPAPGA